MSIASKLSVTVAAGQNRVMHPAPINPQWVRSGQPMARSSVLSQSVDGDALTCIWDCTSGAFDWHFHADETVLILEGSVAVAWQDQRFVLQAGDSAYFPAGSVTFWQVETYVRKVAFIREVLPRPVSFGFRVLRRLRAKLFGEKSSAAG